MDRSAILALALFIVACGPPSAPAPAEAPPNPTATPAAAKLVTPEITAALAALPVPYNGADYVNGRRVFQQCRSCHNTKAEAGNSVGPNLHGVFGRKAGSIEGFAYSPALKRAAFTWDGAQLEQWLANPQTFLPGNRMTFAGIRKAEDRRDAIAYLHIETAQ